MRSARHGVTWTRTAEPAQEPITLAEAKLQMKITQVNEDALIRSYIVAGRQAAEEYMSRGLFTQTWLAVCPDFADRIPLPMAAPLQSVTSVKYYDTTGTLQTLATTYYTVDTTSRPGRIVRAPSQMWPSIQADRLEGAVQITYVVGWATVAAIPERIKQGIRFYVTYLDADREGMDPAGKDARLAAERCWADQVDWLPPEWYRPVASQSPTADREWRY